MPTTTKTVKKRASSPARKRASSPARKKAVRKTTGSGSLEDLKISAINTISTLLTNYKTFMKYKKESETYGTTNVREIEDQKQIEKEFENIMIKAWETAKEVYTKEEFEKLKNKLLNDT